MKLLKDNQTLLVTQSHWEEENAFILKSRLVQYNFSTTEVREGGTVFNEFIAIHWTSLDGKTVAGLRLPT